MGGEVASPWLHASGLTKVYGGVTALEDASVSVHAGEARGLVGPNGAGKSTLVKLLTGLVSPTSGSIAVDGEPLALGDPTESLRAGIVAVPQELTVAPGMTVAENIMLGHYPSVGPGFLSMREARRAAKKALKAIELNVDPDAQVGQLPHVEQRLVMVARALSVDARLVIFDEPTATISPLEVDLILKAIGSLGEHGVSVLYASHHLDEVVQICSSATVIRDGHVAAELQGSEVTHPVLVQYLTGREESESVPQAGPKVSRRVERDGPILEMRDVVGAQLSDVSLKVHPGEIVGLAGLAGSGAREVLLTVSGALSYKEGEIAIEGRVIPPGSSPVAVSAGMAYLPGDRSLGVFPGHSVRFNVSLPEVPTLFRTQLVDQSAERTAVDQVLDEVNVQTDGSSSIASLSGGNQQRVLIARWFHAGAKVLLLDDPTAGVDVGTRPEVHKRVQQACDGGVGVLLVTTDTEELVELADTVLVMERGRIKGALSGSGLTANRVVAAMTGQEIDWSEQQ